MIFAKEIPAPFIVGAKECDLPVYARIDITRKSDLDNFLAWDHQNKIPLLFLPALEVHPSRMDDQFIAQTIQKHSTSLQNLMSHGMTRCVIAADNDGALHKLLSPKFRPRDVHVRAQPLFDLYEVLSLLMPNVELVLTVEDLSPGGLDATDGILIARELHRRGLANIIATAGTKDFPLLFDRRVTQKKEASAADFFSNEPSLASAMWLLDHTHLKVSCYAVLHDKNAAIDIAQKLGFVSLIEKAQTIAV